MKWDRSPFDSLSRRYNTPYRVQKFVRSLQYNREEGGNTVRSAMSVLRFREAHCLEAAFLSAAILERQGYPPLVLSMESQDDLDHVVFVFQERGRWGAIGRSREDGLHGRAPAFRSLRDLAYSYFDPFVDNTGRVTAYGATHLDQCGADWRLSRRNVWKAEQYLIDLHHKKIRGSERRYKKWLNYFLEHGTSGKRTKHWW